MSIPPIVNDDPTSLREAEFYRVRIIDRVFALLVTMIEVLQKTTATLAERLGFLTSWQKAYTDQMDQVHTFVQNNGDAFSDETGDSSRQMRDELNRINTTFTEQMRSRRSIVSDDAKALQTAVNQLSDAVNQQTNMATSLIQQLSTILSVIFR